MSFFNKLKKLIGWSPAAESLDGTEKLLVLTDPDGAAVMKVATTQQIADLGGGGGPLVFAAVLTQTGTAVPTVTVLKNELGVTLTPSRSFAGFYQLTAPSAVFTAGKTLALISNNGNYTAPSVQRFLAAYCGTTTTITLTVSNTTTLADGFDAQLLIYVFP